MPSVTPVVARDLGLSRQLALQPGLAVGRPLLLLKLQPAGHARPAHRAHQLALLQLLLSLVSDVAEKGRVCSGSGTMTPSFSTPA